MRVLALCREYKNINNLALSNIHYTTTFQKTPTMPEILGPHFFSRVFKEEGEKGGGGPPDAAPREEYLVELSATGLGMKDNLDAVPILGADHVAIGFSGSDNTGNDRREKVGSVSVSITKTHFQKSKKSIISCTIEQLDVNTGDTLTDMQAFAVILRRIQTLCTDNNAEHLVMVGSESFRMFSGLLEHAGFTLCDCERPSKNVSVGSQSQLCMDLPTRPTRSPVHKDQDHPISSSTRDKEHVAAPANRTSITKTANTGGPFANKKYCIGWIWRGECAYMQVGCRYKHEIPLDKETREKIGMRGIPKWFKESPHWGPWLQQAERLELTRNGHDNASFLARPSGGPSHPRAKDISSRGEVKATMKPRGLGNFGAYMAEFPRQNPNQDTVASDITVEGSRVGPASATAIDSTKAITRTASRRPSRQIYKPPGALEPSVAVQREDCSMDESSDVWDNDVEEQIRGQAKRPKLEFQHQ